MVKKIAFLFPGQGAQCIGMGKDFYDNYECSKKIFDTADKILNKNITKICFEGPENILKQTENTQPSIVTTSIAAIEALKLSFDITPDFTAGHSLGEYCAMYVSGVLDLEMTLKAIQKRAELMSTCSKEKKGAMAAVLNATDEQLKAGLAEGSKIGYVDVANYNSPSQVVITGEENAVNLASDYMIANGVRRIIPLAVSGAFHSKLMENAGKDFEKFVSNLDLKDASIPVITNVDAQPTVLASDFRLKMPKQIYSSVYWTQTIEKMVSKGVEIFIEIGPGKVLAGLNKKITPNSKIFNIFDIASLESTISALKAEMSFI